MVTTTSERQAGTEKYKRWLESERWKTNVIKEEEREG
jgi:hypothetical protein